MQTEYEFEWDTNKDKLNLQKHGVSFKDAQKIWDDPLFVEIHLESSPEDRWAVIGQINKNNYLTAIMTYRGGKVRIISARKATKKEVDIYDQH